MRGADAYNEALFSTVKLEEFVPQSHPLRPIRKWLNEALAEMDAKFSAMYEADVKGGRPSIAPEKLMRAMLLQVLYSVRSERQLVEQISYNLLFRGLRKFLWVRPIGERLSVCAKIANFCGQPARPLARILANSCG